MAKQTYPTTWYSFPPEIQRDIIGRVYTPEAKFPNQTALLRVSKQVYDQAYPAFLSIFSSYELDCVPLTSETTREPDEASEVGGGDMLRIAWPSDLGRWDTHYLEPKWMHGFKSELMTLFDHARDEQEEELATKKRERERDREERHREEAAVKKRRKEEYMREHDDEDEYESDSDSLDGFSITTPSESSSIDIEYKQGDLQLGQRAENVADWMIRRKPFMRLLRKMGKENAARIQRLKIAWGEGQNNRTGTNYYNLGDYAVAMMSVVCSLWLPGIKHVTLYEKPDSWKAEVYQVEPRLANESLEEYYTSTLQWNDGIKDEHMQRDGGPLIQAIKMLVDACPNLESLKLENWQEQGRMSWWEEAVQQDGLKVEVDSVYARPVSD